MTIDVSKIKAGDTVTVTLNDGFTGTGPVEEGWRGSLLMARENVVLREVSGQIGIGVKSIDDWQPKAPEWHADPNVIAIKDSYGNVRHRNLSDEWQTLEHPVTAWSWEEVVESGSIHVYGRRV